MIDFIMIFVVILFIFIIFQSVVVRTIVFNPIKSLKNGIVDFYYYYKHKMYNFYDCGKLVCYMAHFGKGKTLSAVHDIYKIYNSKNNKIVWDRERKKFVTQKVHIISNVCFTDIPYEELTSLSQVVACAMHNKDIDVLQDTRTVTLVLIDEASSQFNSRNFKSNIDSTFLACLLAERHYNMSIFYTSQKFSLTDALLRQVTQTCIQCSKVWRVMVLSYFNADEMENALNPTIVKPLYRKGFFILNRDFNRYDTLAVVSNLKKSIDSNDMMSEREIIEMRGQLNPDSDAVNHSRRYKRRNKK